MTSQASYGDSQTVPTGSAVNASLTPDQAADLADAEVRATEGTRATLRIARLRARIAKAATRVDECKTRAIREIADEAESIKGLGSTGLILRPMRAIWAAVFTALLMFAGYFSINAVLAAADLSPLESFLLPLAFGPVFVLATKVTTSGWLDTASDDRTARRAVIGRLIAPILLLASALLISGVALKSMAVGSLQPLNERYAHISSILMFAALMLGELAGAAALAASQHAPGARAFEYAKANVRRSRRIANRAIHAAFAASARYNAVVAKLYGIHEWQAGRGAMARVWGWLKATRKSSVGDELMNALTIGAWRFDSPVGALRSVPNPAPAAIPYLYRPGSAEARPDDRIDEEFRRLLRGRNGINAQDMLW